MWLDVFGSDGRLTHWDSVREKENLVCVFNMVVQISDLKNSMYKPAEFP